MIELKDSISLLNDKLGTFIQACSVQMKESSFFLYYDTSPEVEGGVR